MNKKYQNNLYFGMDGVYLKKGQTCPLNILKRNSHSIKPLSRAALFFEG